MKKHVLVTIASLALGMTPMCPALAAGCLSGGAVGGLAGHVAGHHAVLGAAGGCIVGHEMNKHDKKMKAQQAAQQPQ